MKPLNDLNKENLYKYYIEENHSRKECLDYFNCSLSALKAMLFKERIVKNPLKSFSISVQDVYDYYIVQRHSLRECCEFFNCNQEIIMNKVHLMGVRKKAPKGYSSAISSEVLYKYYIDENHTFEDTCSYFKISTGSLVSLLQKYNIHKDYHLRLINLKNTCIMRYGVENVSHSKEIAKLRGGKYLFQGVKFDSKWELYLYIYAKDHDEYIERCPCVFDYTYKDKTYVYIPDFIYKNDIVEIKGEQFFDGDNFINPYDRSLDEQYSEKYKCMLDNNVIIMRKDDLKPVFNYIKNTYGENYYTRFKIK